MSDHSPAKSRWRRIFKSAAIAAPFVLLATPVAVVTMAALFSEKLRLRIAGAFVGGMAQNPPAIVITALAGLAIAWVVITIICVRERWFPGADESNEAATRR